MEERAAPATPTQGIDPASHVSILTTLNYIGAALAFVWALITWSGVRAFNRMASTGPFPDAPGPNVEGSITLLAVGLFVLAVLHLYAAIGLTRREEWGRNLAFLVAGVVGFFSLFSFAVVPLAFAAYTFWALTRPDVANLFESPREAADSGV